MSKAVEVPESDEKNRDLKELVKREYKEGFVTDIESDTIAPGLSEDTVRLISSKKNEPEFMLEYRLKAFRRWQKMAEPDWAHIDYPKIDFQAISYYSAPKEIAKLASLDEVDPKILETYSRLGIPLEEQKMLANVAVDAVFDSVSVRTTFRKTLSEAGVIFMPISEAVHEHPELIKKYLSSVVPGKTITTRHSTRRSSVTAHLYTSLKACVARWSYQLIFGSTKLTLDNLSAH